MIAQSEASALPIKVCEGDIPFIDLSRQVVIRPAICFPSPLTSGDGTFYMHFGGFHWLRAYIFVWCQCRYAPASFVLTVNRHHSSAVLKQNCGVLNAA